MHARQQVSGVFAHLPPSPLFITARQTDTRVDPVSLSRTFSARGAATQSVVACLFENPARTVYGKLPDLIISPAAGAIPATIPTRAREVRALRPSFVDGQGTSLQGLPVQACDCPLNVFAIAEFDKTKPSWRPCHLVANDQCRGHLKARIGYKFAERRISRAMG